MTQGVLKIIKLYLPTNEIILLPSVLKDSKVARSKRINLCWVKKIHSTIHWKFHISFIHAKGHNSIILLWVFVFILGSKLHQGVKRKESLFGLFDKWSHHVTKTSTGTSYQVLCNTSNEFLASHTNISLSLLFEVFWTVFSSANVFFFAIMHHYNAPL